MRKDVLSYSHDWQDSEGRKTHCWQLSKKEQAGLRKMQFRLKPEKPRIKAPLLNPTAIDLKSRSKESTPRLLPRAHIEELMLSTKDKLQLFLSDHEEPLSYYPCTRVKYMERIDSLFVLTSTSVYVIECVSLNEKGAVQVYSA